MDRITTKQRSFIMSRIKSKNTKPELLVFRELRKRKIYFYKHYSKIPGKPDIALPRKKIAVFIDGEFWHGHNFSKLKKRLPNKYWMEKIAKNMDRDRKTRNKLRKNGWRILKIWAGDLKKPKVMGKIITFLDLPKKII